MVAISVTGTVPIVVSSVSVNGTVFVRSVVTSNLSLVNNTEVLGVDISTSPDDVLIPVDCVEISVSNIVEVLLGAVCVTFNTPSDTLVIEGVCGLVTFAGRLDFTSVIVAYPVVSGLSVTAVGVALSPNDVSSGNSVDGGGFDVDRVGVLVPSVVLAFTNSVVPSDFSGNVPVVVLSLSVERIVSVDFNLSLVNTSEAVAVLDVSVLSCVVLSVVSNLSVDIGSLVSGRTLVSSDIVVPVVKFAGISWDVTSPVVGADTGCVPFTVTISVSETGSAWDVSCSAKVGEVRSVADTVMTWVTSERIALDVLSSGRVRVTGSLTVIFSVTLGVKVVSFTSVSLLGGVDTVMNSGSIVWEGVMGDV